MFAVALSTFALAGSVPVTGGTAAQRAVVRRALEDTDPGAITSARIDGRHYLVLGAPHYPAPSVRYSRAVWEAEALGVTTAGTLAARGEGIAGFAVAGNLEMPYRAAPPTPPLGLDGARKLRGDVLARAAAAGLAVRAARVLGGGAVDVVVRLREDQLLNLPAALATLFGDPSEGVSWPHFLAVEAPDGTAIAYGGTFGSGGSWTYGGDTGTAPVPKTVPERLWRARTDLVVKLTRGTGTRTFHILCGGSRPAPGSRCARVLADRWALLVPPMPGITCGGVAFAWSVTMRGTVAGQAVDRGYDSCYYGTAARWARFLWPSQ